MRAYLGGYGESRRAIGTASQGFVGGSEWRAWFEKTVGSVDSTGAGGIRASTPPAWLVLLLLVLLIRTRTRRVDY